MGIPFLQAKKMSDIVEIRFNSFHGNLEIPVRLRHLHEEVDAPGRSHVVRHIEAAEPVCGLPDREI